MIPWRISSTPRNKKESPEGSPRRPLRRRSYNASRAALRPELSGGEATLHGQLIDGPDVIVAYFRQVHASAEAHAVNREDGWPSENRAYRAGCRAYVEALCSATIWMRGARQSG